MAIVIAKSRPHEKLLLAYSAILGLVQLAGLGRRPTLLAQVLPAWGESAWDALMLIAGLVGMAGCYWRGHGPTGLRLEQAGMLIGAGPLVFYAVVIMISLGLGVSSSVGAGLVMAWAGANLARAIAIERDIRQDSNTH